MQYKGKYSWMKHLDFLCVDLLALFISFILSYWMKFGNVGFSTKDSWRRLLLIISLLNIIVSLFTNPYSGIFRRSYYQEIKISLRMAVINLTVTSVLFYLFKMGADFSREVYFVMYGIYFVLSILMRYIWKKLLLSRKITINSTRLTPLFVVCDSESIEKVINNISAGDFQLYDIKGVYLINNDTKKTVPSVPVISNNYVDFVLENNIGDVMISAPTTLVSGEDYRKLAENGINIHINVESILGFQTENQYITNLGVYKTLTAGDFSFTPGQLIYLGIKRVVDIIFGLLGLIALIPITLGVKLANIASGDKASIFYRHERIGQNGKTIRIWKFRSMVPNADERLKELLKQERYREEWEQNQKLDDDPRITKVGKFIRKTSIDELPQLLNVLAGDMSLVGPRPLVKGELEAHGGLKLYERVKPGITGWWGCNGRSNIDYRERLELEYYYVKNCSLYLDILCILRTVLAVLKKDGAQ